MKRFLKTVVVSSMVLAMTLTASIATAVTYPVLTKTAANFTIKNVAVTSTVPGLEKLVVKTSATATPYTLTNLVPLITSVQRLGGTVTISGTNATIKYDGRTTVLSLTNEKITPKVGIVYYIGASTLAAKLLTPVNSTGVPVAANLTTNTLSRSVKTANFTVINIETKTTLQGIEHSYVAPVTVTNLVPLVSTVKALGGIVTVSGTTATINYDGTLTTLALTAQNSRKIGTVYYVEASALADKLVVTVRGTDYKLAVNLESNSIFRTKSAAINYQWSTSGHAASNATTFKSPINSPSCVRCHDGAVINIADKTFSSIDQVPNYVPIPDPADPTKTTRDLTKVPVISCSTCHPASYDGTPSSGSAADYGTDAAAGQAYLDTLYATTGKALPTRAADIAKSGDTPLLSNGSTVVNVGRSALCITCHEGRRRVNTASPTSGPHYSNEADIVFGFGGYDYGTNFYTNSPHGYSERACLTCHMPKVNGASDHSWSLTNANGIEITEKVAAACGICHNGLNTLDRKASGDYDGNKSIETIEKEINGLKIAVKAAIIDEAKKVDSSVVDFSGMYFYNVPYVSGTPSTNRVTVADPTFKFYYALWNYNTIANDGSGGIHNPGYEVNLLQATYKNLTGVDVPGATLKRLIIR